ncbi:Uncharacterized protein HZ326_0562 [Fusarium oxysporum f. sp. albedinis]|nr:Uncharacterized protein HZ326_0562 [Fusarium oxysporum f. sp. albedinis]
MRLIHDLSGLSGQVKSSRRGSSGVDRDAGDGEIVTLQNHAYQLCDEIRCDTICDFRTLLRKYEQSQGRLFSYSKRRVYSYESSVQSGVDKKKKKRPGAISEYCNALLQSYLALQGKKATDASVAWMLQKSRNSYCAVLLVCTK